MGKSKSKSKDSAAAAAAAAAKKCTCEHDFNCECGNRPPRPSRGHKWDSEAQAWGGKGHKQKGGSGQTKFVAESAKTTAVGNTAVAQWQQLPSQLLQEVCKRQRRPPPKFKNIEIQKGSVYKYRCIVPDPKESDRDLFFVPSRSVANEEQSKEEAALLALLDLTPKLPHERKLPEPYRTTWLNAVTAAAAASSQQKPKAKTSDSSISHTTDNNSQTSHTSHAAHYNSQKTKTSGSAQASSILTSGKTYSSTAEKRKQQEAKRQERNTRVRRHEAVRMANLDHPVFMSAQIRKQIEGILRGDSTLLQDDGDDDQDDSAQDTEDDVQVYVMMRLHGEGFTKRHVRTAYKELSESLKDRARADENAWDKVYEESLQWLLVHLNEDQLPEGFDPRGRTLDVVVPTQQQAKAKAKQDTNSSSGQGANNRVDENVVLLASRYGLSIRDASAVQQRALEEKITAEDALWMSAQAAANVSLGNDPGADDGEPGRNREIVQDELEALEAIFASECKVVSIAGWTTVSVSIDDGAMLLEVVVQDGVYPAAYPKSVLVSGKWPPRQGGAALHLEVVKFVASLELGEPMIFEIHGHVQVTLQSIMDGELSAKSLLPAESSAVQQTASKETDKTTNKTNDKSRDGTEKIRASRAPAIRRPRVRGHFWSTPLNKSPAATAFPKIPMSMERTRKSLPAATARAEFLAVMKKADLGGRVLLVEGDTGCGKTTQIPQFILEESPNDVKIVVTQPRRLAATGVAARVASERGENQPGVDSVGYVVRGDSAMSMSTRLLFCTTGVLLRQLQSEGALDCITHIVVDEVHERQLDTDILLGLLKQSLKTHKHLRVILMSATLDADRFAAYWGDDTPRMHIPGRTFPVEDFMLEDVLALTGYIPPKKRKGKQGFVSRERRQNSSPWADSEKSDEEPEDASVDESCAASEVAGSASGNPTHSLPIEELVKRVDETSVDYDLLGQLVKNLVASKGPRDDGSILVFLSGAPEINNAMETIRRCTMGLRVLLLPLHGGLQPKDQNLVFRPCALGTTKVILSTNVAETSVTIPDCTIVIDSAREKQSSYDPANRMPLLIEHFASKASLKQRRGRAGRVREGTCYKLISRATYGKLRDHGEPEIQRCALDQTLLSLLFLGVERGSGTFMRTLLDPPSKESLQAATFSLLKIGAVEPDGQAGDLRLTPMGVHLAGIPAPPMVGKMLVMGSILGCRTPALAMAAGLTLGRSPFLRVDTRRKRRNNGEDDQASTEEMKQERILEERASLFKTVGNSDHALLAAVYMKWQDSGSGLRRPFCESLGLSFNGMRDMMQLVNQMDSSLKAAGYTGSAEADSHAHSWRIIRACAVSSMAPSQLVKVRRPAVTYQETAEGAQEKDGEAKGLKFFVRIDIESSSTNETSRAQEERVFIHPSSANFTTGSYNCPWLVYHSLVRTSKAFLRDVTECSAYALLLFGGQLEVQAASGIILVDGWAQLSANARIGSLIGGLRKKVDELLTKKVEDPSFELANTPEMNLIVKLIRTDGLGT